MDDDLIKCLNESEINFLTFMINSVRINDITSYYFKESEINNIINDHNLDKYVIKGLMFKKVIKRTVSKICKSCNSEIELCECEEEDKDVIEKIYYIIQYEFFIEYFIKTLSVYYGIKLNKIQSTDKKEIQYNVENYEIIIQINNAYLQEEFFKNCNLKNKLVISIMPVDFHCDNSIIYEWHEVLNKENIDNLKIKINELSDNVKNRDLYFIDVGDDVSIEDIENMRMVFRKYMSEIGFINYTENKKYRPEYIKYSLPIEKIKECFIKDNYKIFILKQTEKQLSIAYFENGNLGESGYLYNLIRKYDLFIKAKMDKFRRIKFLEIKSDKSQKVIQLIAPIINLITIIAPTIISLFVTNDFINSIIKVFSNKTLFKIVYIIVNVLGIVITSIYSVYPYIARVIFRWDYGIKNLISDIDK